MKVNGLEESFYCSNLECSLRVTTESRIFSQRQLKSIISTESNRSKLSKKASQCDLVPKTSELSGRSTHTERAYLRPANQVSGQIKESTQQRILSKSEMGSADKRWHYYSLFPSFSQPWSQLSSFQHYYEKDPLGTMIWWPWCWGSDLVKMQRSGWVSALLTFKQKGHGAPAASTLLSNQSPCPLHSWQGLFLTAPSPLVIIKMLSLLLIGSFPH